MYFEMKFSVTITVALLFVYSASAIKWGRCTTTTKLKDFDLMRFQGTWYQAAGSRNIENGIEGRCHEIEYSISGEGQLSYVAYSVYDDLDTNMTSIIEGVINFDLETPMKWEVEPSKWIPATMFWVHDTDYDRYAFMYSCENRFLLFREEMIWVLTRERMTHFESSTYQYISGRLDMTELDRSNLVASNQTMCRMDGHDDDDHI